MADLRPKRIAELIEPLRVTPGRRVTLEKHFDPGYKAGFLDKEEGTELLAQGVELLSEYQERLAAQDTHGVIVVLQALDAAGKDGTIRHVMSGVNPQGVSVHSYKAPSPLELDHEYLWRFASNLPRRGEIGIFNRSYYEEVLVVRVHPEILANEQLPRQARGRDVWKKRYRDINEWERYLTDNGFTVVKLFLNLSKEEQRIRFLRRIDLPDHNWKFSAADVKERAYWDDYQKAFSAMLSNTSTEWAPWYVIPADHKWFARICASAVIANALIKINPQFPKVTAEAHDALMETKGLLEAEAPDGAEADPFEAELAEKAKAGGKGGKKGKKKGGKKAKKR
jgi:PPK2 family polyphosphate:nucleotide phosphotransferase